MSYFIFLLGTLILTGKGLSLDLSDPFDKAIYLSSVDVDKFILEQQFAPTDNLNAIEVDKVLPQLMAVNEKYLEIVETASRESMWYEIGGRVITNAIEIASDLSGEMQGKYGASTSAILTSIKNGVDYSTVRIVDKIKEDAQKSANEILIVALRDWEERTNQSVSSLGDLSLEEKFMTVIGQEFFDQWDPELFEQSPAAMVQGFMMTKLKDGLVEFYEQNKDQYSDLKDKLDDNANKLIASSKTLNSFAEQTQEQLQSIIDEQQIIVNGLNNINAHVRKNLSQSQENGKHIGFIEEVLYTQLDPRQRLAALKKGMLDISPEERLIQIQKIEVTVSQIELNEKISTYIQGANLIVDIASNMGLSGPDFKNVSKGIQVASGLGTAFIQASTQGPIGYLQAASTVSSLIGLGSKKDAAASRHQQVMNTLNKVIDNQRALMEGQQEIKQGILALFEGQKVIIENQKIILDQILELRKETALNHAKVISKLDNIFDAVGSAIDILNSIISKDLKMCESFLESKPKEKTINGKFDSYAALIAHFELWNREFLNCYDGISSAFGRDKIDSNFILYKGMGRFDDEREAIYEYYDLFIRKVDLLNDLPQNSSSKLLPIVRNQKDLKAKHESLKVFFNSNYLFGEYDLDYHMNSPLNLSSIIGLIEPIVEIAPYLDMARGNGLATLEELKEKPRNYGLMVIRDAIAIVDIGIAQQNLMSGDILIPYIVEELSNLNDENKYLEIVNTLRESYKYRSPFYRNFMIYYVRHILDLTGQNPISYHFALKQDNTEFLNRILDTEKTVLKDGKFYLTIRFKEDLDSEIMLPLPSAEEVQSGKLYQTPQLNQLLILRSKLQSKLNDYLLPLAFDRDSQLYQDFMILNSTKY